MIAAGLLARNAVAKGLATEALGEDVARAGLAGGRRISCRSPGLQKRSRQARLQPRRLWLHHLHRQFRPAAGGDHRAINDNDLVAAAVLSGNRNFEGRVNPDMRANYLASPPLVVAYALAGSMHVDLTKDPLGHDQKGNAGLSEGHLAFEPRRSATSSRRTITARRCSRRNMPSVFDGDANWKKVRVAERPTYAWDMGSTYVQNPPYFDGMTKEPAAVSRTSSARASSACSSIRSPPITSRPRARSARRARPVNI